VGVILLQVQLEAVYLSLQQRLEQAAFALWWCPDWWCSPQGFRQGSPPHFGSPAPSAPSWQVQYMPVRARRWNLIAGSSHLQQALWSWMKTLQINTHPEAYTDENQRTVAFCFLCPPCNFDRTCLQNLMYWTWSNFICTMEQKSWS
jgi:hypothetical protein